MAIARLGSSDIRIYYVREGEGDTWDIVYGAPEGHAESIVFVPSQEDQSGGLGQEPYAL